MNGLQVVDISTIMVITVAKTVKPLSLMICDY